MGKELQRTGPKLKSGGDAEAAAHLEHLCDEARSGLRRVIALGMFCFKIKGDLPHGQFGPWIEAHCNGVSYRSLRSYMQLTEGVLKKCGIPNWQTLPFCHGGEFLLLPEAKVPDAALPLRKKICEIIDGKSAHQLMFEFAQADEDDEGNVKSRRGRLKGCKGTTKEQRQAAREREERERIEGIELDTQDHDKWMEKNGGPKGVGLISANRFKKHLATVEWYYGILKTLAKQRGDAA